MKILMVITSHAQLGDTGEKTGYWLEEVAAAYNRFKEAGVELVLASPKGGKPPLDPMSAEPDYLTDDTRRFAADAAAQIQLATTVRLDSQQQQDFAAVFYPGGHGPLFDLAEDQHSIQLIEAFWAAGKPVALVCHAPGALRHVRKPDGSPLVAGKQFTGFSNTEEAAVKRTAAVPFLLEDDLQARGGIYSRAADQVPHLVTDGLLLTGQNPASSGPAAEALLKLLQAVRV